MATYAGLVDDIRARLDVSSNDAGPLLVASWINPAELDLWRAVRALVNRRETVLTTGADSYRWVLPSGLTAVSNVIGDDFPFIRKSLDFVTRLISEANTDKPCWAIGGSGELVLSKVVTGCTLVGYHRFSGLADGDPDATAALDDTYDLYLYRSLAEACEYYDYPERFNNYMLLVERAIGRINAQEDALL